MNYLNNLPTIEVKEAIKSLHNVLNFVNNICPSYKRNLTICSGRNTNTSSSVLLAGHWLREAGFEPGLNIRLTVMKELIVIIPEEAAKQKYL